MSDILDKFTVEMLDNLQQRYKAAGDTEGMQRVNAALATRGALEPVNTTELSHSGRLWQHKTVLPDDTGRTATRYTGDIGAFLAPFVRGAIASTSIADLDATCRDFENQRRENETRRVMEAGQRALAAGR